MATMQHTEALRAAKLLQAFFECSDTIQAGIRDMVEIINDSETDEDDRFSAAITLMEALFPSPPLEIGAATRKVTPESLDFRTGKLVVRVGEGKERRIFYNGENLSVVKMNIDLDFERDQNGDPVVKITIIP